MIKKVAGCLPSCTAINKWKAKWFTKHIAGYLTI